MSDRPRAQKLTPSVLGKAPAQQESSERIKSDARVVLVDDHRMFLAGVSAEIGEMVDVVGKASSVNEAIEVIYRTKPDVVLLDVHMPDGGGAEVLRRVADAQLTTEQGEPVQFLALSVSDDPTDVISLIRAGARGYLTKSVNATELVDAIERVRSGDAVFSPRLAGFVLDVFASSKQEPVEPVDDPDYDQLTPREREVLQLIARGYAYKQVANRLDISVKTVESHVSSVLRKLQLSSRYELTRWATDRRIV
ncbi:response regulator transcription factor [Stomatohabitans albus]|uniref:response regulator transcription factor n=1 Tax=Stomatohabitans albus TaxID=3110766 RepID=UPI00300C9211